MPRVLAAPILRPGTSCAAKTRSVPSDTELDTRAPSASRPAFAFACGSLWNRPIRTIDFPRRSMVMTVRPPTDGRGSPQLPVRGGAFGPPRTSGPYESPWTCGPTAFDQALPFAASQLVDQVIAPRSPG